MTKMYRYKLQHVYVFLVFLNVFSVNATCIAEEGNNYTLTCTIYENTASVTWKTFENNSAVRHVQTCFLTPGITCQAGPDGISGYSSTISSDNKTAILTIESVSRRSKQNDGMTWACALTADKTLKEETVCDPLDIYAKPEKPTCSLQKLQPGDTQLSMTCVTNKVFPEAKCQLYKHNETHPLEASINCSHQNYSDPDYFNSTCTVNIDVTRLGVGQHQLFVKMFPNVTNGLNISGIDSDIMPVSLSYPQAEVSSNCFNGTNVKENFIKTGTVSSCACTMTISGNPPGQIQWYRQGNSTPIGSLLSNGSVIFTIKEENTNATQVYYCQVTSALIGSKKTDNFTIQFAYGPDSVNLTGQNQYNQCLGEGQNITVVCSVPKAAVNPKTDFRIVLKKEKITGNGTEQDEGDYFSYTYSFKPNGGGIYNLTCEAENSKFSDLIKTASHNVIVQAPPKDAPVIKIINQEKEEIEISGSIVKIIEGEPVTVTCHVDGGYPPANVTLNCSSLNESSVAEIDASLTFLRFTREMDNQTCICSATHVSGCYQHSHTSVWLNVSRSLFEPLSNEKTDLDAAAVGGGVGAAVIVIVLVILVICVLKRKGFFRGKNKEQNELMLDQLPDKEEETVTVNDVYGTTRPKSEEVVTENDIYGTQPTPGEVVVQNDIYGTGSVPENGARDYSSFTPSITSAATLPGNLDATTTTKNPYSDVAMPSTQPKPAVSAKPKTAIKPKTKYNNVNVSGESAGPGFVIQGDNGNQTYASVLKPAKAVSVCPQPKATSNNDDINGNFYPDQSKKPDIPEKKFLKVEKDAENEKKQRKENKAPPCEDIGLPSTSDSNTSHINDGFTGVEDETNVYSNTEEKNH